MGNEDAPQHIGLKVNAVIGTVLRGADLHPPGRRHRKRSHVHVVRGADTGGDARTSTSEIHRDRGETPKRPPGRNEQPRGATLDRYELIRNQVQDSCNPGVV